MNPNSPETANRIFQMLFLFVAMVVCAGPVRADIDHTFSGESGDSYTQAEVDAIVAQLQNNNGLLAARLAALEKIYVATQFQALQADIAILRNVDNAAEDDFMAH